MTAEEELKDLREQLEAQTKNAKRQKWQSAFMFGAMFLIAIASVAFGLKQKSEAKRYEMLFNKRGDEAADYIVRADVAEQKFYLMRKKLAEVEAKIDQCEKRVAELQPKNKK